MQRRSFLKFFGLLISAFNLRILAQESDKKILFKHGVASGDPTNNRVVIWSKITTDANKKINVNWQVSHTKDFLNIIASGSTKSFAYNDFTIKVDAQIPLKYNAKQIYYRFIANNVISPIGKTKTLPIINPDNFNLAFCSCSNYPSGFFNAYREMALNNDIDLVLHLGDYLYEYGANGYATEDAVKLNRVVDPVHEIISLDDYRKRHALYKTDKDLQLLHASKPMIAVWDDHEFTNDSWKNGAENHSDDEGYFAVRKANAIKAYYEWMPIREDNSKVKIWRKFEIGTLFQLFMLDTRSIYRDKQLEIKEYFTKNGFKKLLYKKDLLKNRQLIGNEQFDWLDNNISDKFKWTILGQQVLVSSNVLPEIFSKLDKNTLPKYIHKYLKLGGLEVPFNTDAWDGYPNERDKLFKILSKSQSNLILAGDTHNSWLSNLYNNTEFVGIEVATPSISSPNTIDTFGSITKDIDMAFINSNKNLKFTNGSGKGFVKLTINSNYIDTQFIYVSTIKSKDYKVLDNNRFRINHNKPI
jgi:alkaline phosphatase D